MTTFRIPPISRSPVVPAQYDTPAAMSYPWRGTGTDEHSPTLWPDDDVSRVPYRVYSDPGIHVREQERIFRGPTWNFLCLEAEIPNPGDYRTSVIGDAPIVVVRGRDGGINALVNRCAHKGALVCYKPRGTVSEFTCVYHNWTYDLDGSLTGVAFRRGVRGEGGMEAGFEPARARAAAAPYRVAERAGLRHLLRRGARSRNLYRPRHAGGAGPGVRQARPGARLS